MNNITWITAAFTELHSQGYSLNSGELYQREKITTWPVWLDRLSISQIFCEQSDGCILFSFRYFHISSQFEWLDCFNPNKYPCELVNYLTDRIIFAKVSTKCCSSLHQRRSLTLWWVEPWASSMLRFLSRCASDTGTQRNGVMTALLANDRRFLKICVLSHWKSQPWLPVWE